MTDTQTDSNKSAIRYFIRACAHQRIPTDPSKATSADRTAKFMLSALQVLFEKAHEMVESELCQNERTRNHVLLDCIWHRLCCESHAWGGFPQPKSLGEKIEMRRVFDLVVGITSAFGEEIPQDLRRMCEAR